MSAAMDRDKLDRNEMLKRMPSLFLLMDELCDAGYFSSCILVTCSVLKEIDGNVLVRNVEMRLKCLVCSNKHSSLNLHTCSFHIAYS